MKRREARCPICRQWSEVVWQIRSYWWRDSACCPKCDQWSEVVWQIRSYWWRDSACCPKCDRPVLVETECEFREVNNEQA